MLLAYIVFDLLAWLYTHTGFFSLSPDAREHLPANRRHLHPQRHHFDETMKNVIQLVRDTRKSKDSLGSSDIVDWT
jgi:hypothetical protein